MVPYGFISSVATESRCRQASTTDCYLSASLPESTAGGTAGSVRVLRLYEAITYATSRRTVTPRSIPTQKDGSTLACTGSLLYTTSTT